MRETHEGTLQRLRRACADRHEPREIGAAMHRERENCFGTVSGDAMAGMRTAEMVRRGDIPAEGGHGMAETLRATIGENGFLQFSEPVQWLVKHPRFGEVYVRGYCKFDAQMQAAAGWGVGLDELPRMKVGLERRAMEAAKNALKEETR